VTQIDSLFLSTFVHELLNALNGVHSVAQTLEDASHLDMEDIEDSADDLMVLSLRANSLVNKLRTITNTKRTLASEKKDVRRLCENILPKPKDIPKALKIRVSSAKNEAINCSATTKESSKNLLPEDLFNTTIESLLFVLLHAENDAFLPEQTILISHHTLPEDLLSFKVSNTVNVSFLEHINNIDEQLVATSRFGLELKMLFYMRSIFGVDIDCEHSGSSSDIRVKFTM